MFLLFKFLSGFGKENHLLLLKKYLAGVRDFDITIYEKACDVNGDGSTNVSDAVLLLKHLAQLIDIDALYG